MYEVSLVNHVTVIGLDEPVPVIFPGLDVTVNPVIAEPPVAPGVNDTADCAFAPLVAETPVGACGAVVEVTAVLEDEDKDVPKLFVAVTE